MFRSSVAAWSVRGNSHAERGVENQDAFLVRELPPGYALAVADGHGAERHPKSAAGAKIAVEVAIEVLESIAPRLESDPGSLSTAELRKLVSCQIVQRWRSAVLKTVESEEIESEERVLEEHGTTLLACYASPNVLFACQLGDGDALYLPSDGPPRRLSGALPLYAGEETESLFGDYAASAFQFDLVTRPAESYAVVLGTDGYSKSFPVSFRHVLENAEQLATVARSRTRELAEEWLESALCEITARGSGDDVTIALATFDVDRPTPVDRFVGIEASVAALESSVNRLDASVSSRRSDSFDELRRDINQVKRYQESSFEEQQVQLRRLTIVAWVMLALAACALIVSIVALVVTIASPTPASEIKSQAKPAKPQAQGAHQTQLG